MMVALSIKIIKYSISMLQLADFAAFAPISNRYNTTEFAFLPLIK